MGLGLYLLGGQVNGYDRPLGRRAPGDGEAGAPDARHGARHVGVTGAVGEGIVGDHSWVGHTVPHDTHG